jgi:hypothetical protein
VLDKEATRRKLKHAGGCRKSVSPVLLATLSGDTLNDWQNSAFDFLGPCIEVLVPTN